MDEVTEARRVTNKVASYLKGAKVFHDDTSRDVSTNLRTIVAAHRKHSKVTLHVSVHFNAVGGGGRPGPIGVEVCHLTQHKIAGDLSRAMSVAGGLINRGPKRRTNLFFLNQLSPSVLLEVAFVDSKRDTELYQQNFDAICRSIASTISNDTLLPVPPPEGPDLEARPSTLRKGDRGPWVVYLQEELNNDNQAGLKADGIFGNGTDAAVRAFQVSRGLLNDGIVGERTWRALEDDEPPISVPGVPPPLTEAQLAGITRIAARSDIAKHTWTGRGRAPVGYIKGFACAYASALLLLRAGYGPCVEMAKVPGPDDKDALSWYASNFTAAGMNISGDAQERFRYLWTLMLGLGMRESSGKYCEGRDRSASNTSSVTAEAGAWQTSFNARVFSPSFEQVFKDYANGAGVNPQGFVEIFREGVTCSSRDWESFGSGDGLRHQQMSRNQPAYAAMAAAITMRNARKHYGPLNRKEAQIVKAAELMLREVQSYLAEEEVAVA
jgi:hypothetical protein